MSRHFGRILILRFCAMYYDKDTKDTLSKHNQAIFPNSLNLSMLNVKSDSDKIYGFAKISFILSILPITCKYYAGCC